MTNLMWCHTVNDPERSSGFIVLDLCGGDNLAKESHKLVINQQYSMGIKGQTWKNR